MFKTLIDCAGCPVVYTGKPRAAWLNTYTNTACNSGDGCEIRHHWSIGSEPIKTAGAHWTGVDCPVYMASVKSTGCSLAERPYGPTLREHLIAYMAKDVAERYIWCSYDMDTNTQTEYIMNPSEFYKFAMKFASYAKDGIDKKTGTQRYRVKIRETAKMRKWLESHCK